VKRNRARAGASSVIVGLLCLLPCTGFTTATHLWPQSETKALALPASISLGIAVLLVGWRWKAGRPSRTGLLLLAAMIILSAVGVALWWMDARREPYFGCVFF
jgi:hypothetical protein